VHQTDRKNAWRAIQNLVDVASGLLLGTELEVLSALQLDLGLVLAFFALQTQHNLLGRLSLLVEDRLGLTTVTHLLAVVTALA